jgi:hypothetical protein
VYSRATRERGKRRSFSSSRSKLGWRAGITHGAALLRRMFRIYVKLCHGATVIRGCTGSGRQSKKQATPRVQTAAAVMPYASMALPPVADAHGYIARYATSRGQR